MNTIFLAGEDMVPTSFSPETSGGSNMDLDMVPRHVVSFSLVFKSRI